MSWAGSIRGRDFWDPIEEILKLQSEMSNWFDRTPFASLKTEYPKVNIWAGEHEAKVIAELPGLDPKTIDVTVGNNTLTLKGSYPEAELNEEEKFIRRERFASEFVRTVELPFAVDSTKVDASYRNGLLTVTLPRAEADKPRKVQIS